MISTRRSFILGLACALPLASYAQDTTEPGAVTGLPVPRFVSLKSSEANIRRGPSLNHRVDWVFLHRGTPLQVTAEFENWRRVRDADGAGGWIHYTLISGVRTALVLAENAPLYAEARENSAIRARSEDGVIGRLGRCTADWCEITVDGFNGWMPKSALWGVERDEIRN